MTPAPTTDVTTHGLRASRRGTRAWAYRPDRVSVTHDAHGRPGITLVSTPGAAFLTLTTVLHAREEDVAALRARLAALDGVGPDDVTLTPLPLEAPEAELLIGDGDGSWRVLASRTTSGVTPFAAAFSVTLDADARAAVIAALAGSSGRLGARYAVTEAPDPTRALVVPAPPAPAPTVLFTDAAGWRTT